MPDQPSIPDLPAQADDGNPGKPTCLVLHGLGGGPYELGPLIEALLGVGLRVSAPILPGHDGPGPMMPPSYWRDWANTAEAAFDDLAARANQWSSSDSRPGRCWPCTSLRIDPLRAWCSWPRF